MVQQDQSQCTSRTQSADPSRILAGPHATQFLLILGLMSSRLKTRMVVMIPDAGGRLLPQRQMAVAVMPLIFLHATATKDRSLLILPVELGRICCAILPPKLILLWKISVLGGCKNMGLIT